MGTDRLRLDLGVESAGAVRQLGIDIGALRHISAGVSAAQSTSNLRGGARRPGRLRGVDGRGARGPRARPVPATLHAVFSVQEEFNLRGAMMAAQRLKPDAAVSVDIMVASDTPDLAERGSLRLGAGPALGMYSFHGRGTLNGTLPHPALVRHFSAVGEATGIALQRSAHTGLLTDSSYVQLVGEGIPDDGSGLPHPLHPLRPSRCATFAISPAWRPFCMRPWPA